MGFDKFQTKVSEYLKSPQFEKDIEEYAQKMKVKDDIMTGRIEKVDQYLSAINFDILMERLKKEHNNEYEDRCYKNGYMPHPNNKLYLLLEYFNEKVPVIEDFVEGVTIDDMPGQTVYLYKGYYFINVSFHTGFTRILTEDKKDFFQI